MNDDRAHSASAPKSKASAADQVRSLIVKQTRRLAALDVSSTRPFVA
jgi:hypothetical protein